MIKISISGIQRLYQEGVKISELKRKIPEEIMRICNSTGNKMIATSRKEYLSGPRPEKLGVVTGNLRSSIRFDVSQIGNITEFKLGTWVKYGKIHELGLPVTVGKKNKKTFNMKERPFLRPSFEKHLPDMKDKLNSMFARLYGV